MTATHRMAFRNFHCDYGSRQLAPIVGPLVRIRGKYELKINGVAVIVEPGIYESYRYAPVQISPHRTAPLSLEIVIPSHPEYHFQVFHDEYAEVSPLELLAMEAK